MFKYPYKQFSSNTNVLYIRVQSVPNVCILQRSQQKSVDVEEAKKREEKLHHKARKKRDKDLLRVRIHLKSFFFFP